MLSYSQIILSVAALVSTVSAGNYGKCRDMITPPKQDPMGWHDKRCPEGDMINATDVIVCASGTSGYDHTETDNDLLRELIDYTGLKDALDKLKTCTIFAPTDRGVVRTAKSLPGYPSDKLKKYDEAATFDFLTDAFNKTQLTDILLYHVSCDDDYSFRDLQMMQTIKTLEGANMMLSEPAHPTPNCNERVRLLDTFRMEMKLKQGNAKIHNTFRDITTKNGKLHMVKSLALFKELLPPKVMHNW